MNASRTSLIVCALLTVLAPAVLARGGGEDLNNPHLWKTRTTSVAVFKNGLGFFMREGNVSLRDGWCVGRQIPPATFGTLAIYSLNDKELVDIVGSGSGETVDFDGVDAPKDVATKRARLESAKGLKVMLTYTHKSQSRTAGGLLVSIGPKFAILENDANSFAVPVAGISRMQILELPLRIHVAGEGKHTPKDTRIGMAYLRKGITWIPEYTLRIIDETTAELTLRGTLINQAEDLIHCDINFVVGVPHFAHTNFLAPIAVGQVIRTIGAAVAPRLVATQIMNRAAIAYNGPAGGRFGSHGIVERPVSAGGDVRSVLGNLPQMGGAAATDYTAYTKKDMTVRRGEKAIVTLFVRKIKFSHLYRWSPPKRMQHFLMLHNATDTAWTTGPCLVISKGRPLSEDLLKYTAKGGYGEMPVTAAINIAHEKAEKEVDRKLKAYHVNGTYFDLVTLEGTLKIRNFQKRTAHIQISAAIPGKPLSATSSGRLTTNAKKLRLSKREGSVTWQIDMKAGETKNLSYKYERYVPSY